jgi:hypothetical protein
MTLSRREMIQATAAAVTVPLIPALAGTSLPPGKFLTAAEFALLEELSDMIIPTDERSPGARAAGVAAYIDSRLAESPEPETRSRWREGLAGVDALSRELAGKPFLQATPEQRVQVVTKMAAAESDPKTAQDRFFKEVKGRTVYAYYTSKAGIQDDQRYKGNVYQNGEYAGYDAT